MKSKLMESLQSTIKEADDAIATYKAEKAKRLAKGKALSLNKGDAGYEDAIAAAKKEMNDKKGKKGGASWSKKPKDVNPSGKEID